MANFPCPHCGQPVEAEHLYCPHCTRSLRLSPEEPSVVSQIRQPNTARIVGWAVGFLIIGIAFVLALPLVLVPKMNSGSRTHCLSNIKQLMTATLIYSSDYDDRMIAGPDVSVALMPYIKNADVFRCANTGMPFALNSKVLGVEIGLVVDPAKTVVFYEGVNEVLEFRHGGAANVAFLDGHARGVKPSDSISFEVKVTPPPKGPERSISQ